MKKFISGLITGIIVCLSLTTFAAVSLNVIPNPYSVLINGHKTQVDGYNINESTYLKLRDFEKAGLKVDFQNNNILITSQTQSINNTEVDTMSKTTNLKITTYNGCKAIEQNGIIYVDAHYLNLFNLKYDSNAQTITFTKNNKTISFTKNDTNYCIIYNGITYVKTTIID